MGKLILIIAAVMLVIDLLLAAGFTLWLLSYRKKLKKIMDDTYE